jgi:putative transposase
VLVHSDQERQYNSSNWRIFLKSDNLVSRMTRRGNGYNNTVTESFFQLLKPERIKRKTCKSRRSPAESHHNDDS